MNIPLQLFHLPGFPIISNPAQPSYYRLEADGEREDPQGAQGFGPVSLRET